MVEEHRVHRFPYLIITTESEGEVAHTATCLCEGQVLLDPFYGADEIDGIGLMLFNARSDRKNIDVEDDVLWRETDGSQEVVGTTSNGNLAFVCRGLSFFVESHHDNCGTQASQFKGFTKEILLSGLETYGVDDAFALRVLQSGQNCLPVAAVDHQDGLAHGRFSADVPAESLHFELAVEHGIVHVDIDDRCPALYLVSCHGECFAVLLFSDETCEFA